ncbi:MAG: hypothetical protein U1D35_14965 [Paracoccaceae bacterium]|nr:hypothetical protein [Paracoccaceae bacterium]
MSAFPDLFRRFVTVSALILLMLGGLGQAMPVHAGMTKHATTPLAVHATGSMSMGHMMLGAASDADKSICELQCLTLAVALPVAPMIRQPWPQRRMLRARNVVPPTPAGSSPDAPPPKHLIL